MQRYFILAGVLLMFSVGGCGKSGQGGPCFQDDECKGALICCGASQGDRGTCETEDTCGSNSNGNPVTEGCGFDALPTLEFRMEQLTVEEPGFFLNEANGDGGLQCANDVTELVDIHINDEICGGNGQFDLSLVVVFGQTSSPGDDVPGRFAPVDCPIPDDSSVECTPMENSDGGLTNITDMVVEIRGQGPCSYTFGGQDVSVSGPNGCFEAVFDDGLVFPLGSLDLPLENVRLLGAFDDLDPARTITEGFVVGSITVDAAMGITVPEDYPASLAGENLVDVLRGPDCPQTDVENVNDELAFVFVFRFEGASVTIELGTTDGGVDGGGG